MKSKDVMYIIFGSVVFSILIIGVLYLVQSWAFERPSEYPNCDVKIYGQFCDDSFESWKWQGDYDVGSIIKSSKYNISGVVCGVQTQDYGGIYIIKSVIGEYTVINGQWLIGLSDEGEDEDPYPNLNPIVPDEPVDQDDLVHPDDFGTYPGDGSNTISGFVFDEFDSRYHNVIIKHGKTDRTQNYSVTTALDGSFSFNMTTTPCNKEFVMFELPNGVKTTVYTIESGRYNIKLSSVTGSMIQSDIPDGTTDPSDESNTISGFAFNEFDSRYHDVIIKHGKTNSTQNYSVTTASDGSFSFNMTATPCDKEFVMFELPNGVKTTVYTITSGQYNIKLSSVTGSMIQSEMPVDIPDLDTPLDPYPSTRPDPSTIGIPGGIIVSDAETE